jgi:hypothetical protein
LAFPPLAKSYPGARFVHPVRDKKMRAWEKMKDLFWGEKGLE